MNGLRRLPWQDNGKPAYVTPGGGLINALADATEGATLTAAEEAAERAVKLAGDTAASRAELRTAIRVLAELTREVANVATLRGERLGMDSESAAFDAAEPANEEGAIRRSVDDQLPAVAAFLADERGRDSR
ncbi:hypothetical protein ACWDA7_45620 [Streptomyces sp. NPDC001156]